MAADRTAPHATALRPPPRRGAGLLLHVTSLPGPYGIGDLGPVARAWIDALTRARQTLWQMLPLAPPGDGNSPYQAFSAFAGNPLLISPDELVRDGLLRRDDVSARLPSGPVDYDRVAALKARLLALAWDRFGGGAGRALLAPFERFRRTQAGWLDDFALFMALREAHGGAGWSEWSPDLVRRDPAALRTARRALADAVDRHRFVQFLFFRQLAAVRAHARRRGVRLVGDLPIFVSLDSSDVWSHPHLFQLDRRRRPTAVAGVPPDMFSKTGQRWGNPLYDWAAMRREGYAWWADRLRAALAQADLVRIDHFRGFEAYWRVPASSPTAQRGRWVKGPGEELFHALRASVGGLPVIAEDLGVITPPVEALRDALGLPGMRVLQFAFGGDDADNPHLPHNHVPNSVAYTGTHDNDTTPGWYASLRARDRARVHRYLGDGAANSPKSRATDIGWSLIRSAWGSVASLAVAPFQDVLGLDSSARMNTPGTAGGNWRWRVTGRITDGAWIDRLADLTTLYGRSSARSATSP
jgi:4-alpha-glucanotransferase